jgi:hypothetical protein
MRFWQKYSYTEYLFGEQSVIFTVSDSYSELFQNVGIQTDIFILESVKKDLNTEEGSYAIDELPFSINQLACQSEEDEKWSTNNNIFQFIISIFPLPFSKR